MAHLGLYSRRPSRPLSGAHRSCRYGGRTAKYNQLLRIEQDLGPQARYGGRTAIKSLP
jgi:hypothetical protein